jgi:hypothetical protein
LKEVKNKSINMHMLLDAILQLLFSSRSKKINAIIGINKRIWYIVFSDRKIKKFIK